MIEPSYLKGLYLCLNRRYIQLIHFLVYILARTHFCCFFLSPSLTLQILSELNDRLLLLSMRQVFLLDLFYKIFCRSCWSFQPWVIAFLPELFQIIDMLSFVGLFAHKDLVFRWAFNLFFEFLGILLSKFQILNSLHFVVNIWPNQRRALNSLLDFFFFLRINFWLETHLYFLSVLFAFFFQFFYLVVLLNLSLLFGLFLFLKNLVEHRTVVLIHFIWRSV